MGFSSQDDLLAEMTAGKIQNCNVYQKTHDTAPTAGYWTDLSVFAGTPTADAYTGTSVVYVPTDNTTASSWALGGDVSTDTKHFLNFGASCNVTTGAPWIIMAVDQVGYVPISSANYTAATHTITMTALGNTTGKGDRYAYGEGLRMMVVSQTAPTTGGGNITVTYTASGASGSTGQTTVASSTLAAAPKGHVIHSGPVATRAAPFLNLAAGHTGVKDIESVTFAATAYTGSGRLAILLVKPLFVLPIPTAGMHSMTDLVNMMPSMPKIPDGACVKLMAYHTAATTANANFLATTDVVWG
jgi:hypothetical protein